jgi:hypothetical protein
MKTLILIITLAASGCTFCNQHPVACTAAGVIVTGSIAVSLNRNHTQRDWPVKKLTVIPVDCSVPGACT